jgi:hypothetical protein
MASNPARGILAGGRFVAVVIGQIISETRWLIYEISYGYV